jgi:hypothetical protein
VKIETREQWVSACRVEGIDELKKEEKRGRKLRATNLASEAAGYEPCLVVSWRGRKKACWLWWSGGRSEKAICKIN